jgi:hypothetical protein
MRPLAARAALIESVQSVAAPAGSSGLTFDVTLMNTGPGSFTIGGFTFGIQASTSNITFAGVTTATTTAPYIFDGLGLFGPNIGNPPGTNPPSITAGDLFSVIGSGATLGSGQTVGLGHVSFNVPSGAPAGPITISLVPSATSLTDASFPTPNIIPINTLNSGTVTVTGGVIPEPSSLLIVISGTVAGGLPILLSRRRPAGSGNG